MAQALDVLCGYPVQVDLLGWHFSLVASSLVADWLAVAYD